MLLFCGGENWCMSQPLPRGNNRLVAIRLKGTVNLVICSVYLPSSNRSLSNFKKTLEEIEQFYYEQKTNGATACCYYGGFQCTFKSVRFSQTLNARGKLLHAMLTKLYLRAIKYGALRVN